MRKLLTVLITVAALASGASQAAIRYVDPANPAATDSGAGDALHPYRTLKFAMTQLKPGDTLNIAGGVYRESLTFPGITWGALPTVIQPAGSAAVTIKGSDIVTGWAALGGGLFVKNGWTANSQQVFLDGVTLKQIGGKIWSSDPWIWPGRVAGGLAEMVDNSFYYDIAAQNLYIKVPLTSLSGHSVEVSVRGKLVDATNVHNVTIRKLRFQHSNITASSQNAAITLWRSNRNTLESLEVTDCDGAGFDVTGEDNVLRNNKANRNGQLGMKVRGKRALLEGNETNYNNTRGFQKWWEAGGAKFVGEGGLIDSTVKRHVAVGNTGDGIWFDWMNSNNRVYENLSAYNTGMGIHYEASQKGYIYNNYVFANKQRGIYLPHSSGSVVAFNMVARNGYEGIVIVDEGRSPDNPLLRPTGNLVHGNIIAWNGRSALVLPLVLADNRADYNLFLGLTQPAFSLGWPTAASPVRTGLAAWREASGQDLHSWHQAFDIPATLAAAIDQKNLYPDWSEVLARASGLSVPALADILPSHARPGPSLQLVASGSTAGGTTGDTTSGGSTSGGATGGSTTDGTTTGGTTDEGTTTGGTTTGGTATSGVLRYVNPAHAGATDSGAGDALHPYRTLTFAMTQVKPGDTLTVAGGTYRESLIFPNITWSDAKTTITAAAGATVTIKGSDIVSGWSALGGGLFVKGGWAVNSQQVFVDGVSLQQVGGKIFSSDPWIWPGRIAGEVAEMTANSFYYDSAAKKLYIKVPYTSLSGHTVEVSVRPHLLFGQGLRNVTVRKLFFRHSNATALSQTGAVHLIAGNRVTLEHLDVKDCDGAGFDITADDSSLVGNKAAYCGQLGMKVRGRANWLEANETSFNNTRGFQKWWEAGGAKFVGNGGLRDSVVKRHRAIGNLGDGLWFDWMNSNNRISENISAYNSGMGIHYAASQKGFIFDNYVFGNRQRGIYLPHSSGSVVAFNMVVNNRYEGIAVVDEGRDPANPLLRPRGNLVHANIIAWNGRTSLVLPLVLADNRSDHNLFLGVTQPTFALGWPSSTSPIRNGLDAWRKASGQDLNSRFQVFDIPPALRTAFDQRNANPDWSAVRALASTVIVPTLSGILPQSTIHKPNPGPEQ